MNSTRLARNLSAGLVAAIAAVASYDHMRTLAASYGQAPLIADLMPLSVDGLFIVATVAMADDKASGAAPRWSAKVAFAVGVVASISANILATPGGVIARVISAWPAVALLLVVEVLSRRGRAVRVLSAQASEPVPTPIEAAPTGVEVEAAPTGPDDRLVTAARTVADQLRAQGHRITRDRLAAALRAAGHPVSTDRARDLARLVADPA